MLKVNGGTLSVNATVTFNFCLSSQQGELSKELLHRKISLFFNPIAQRKAKIVFNFGLSGCNRVKNSPRFGRGSYKKGVKGIFLCKNGRKYG